MNKMRKYFSILLCLCLLLQNCPVVAFAAGTDGLCEHHTEHTADCGYVEAMAGSDCTHAHDEHCGYIEAVEGVSCACVAAEDGTLTHAEGCGYVAPIAGADCAHVHDDACGYVAAVEAHECHYECAECENPFPSGEGGTAQAVTDEVCTCGTDDEAIHATTCPVYAAPENPQCFCAEKCSDTNIWCDVCGFDHTRCGGTDTAAGYSGPTVTGVTVTVDGQEYTEGTVYITENTTSLVFTVTGSGFTDPVPLDRYFLSVVPRFASDLVHYMNPNTNIATLDYSERLSWFTSCTNFRVQYSIDGRNTWIDTDIYLTYGEEPAAAITGVSVTVDGTTYTEGNVTIKSTSSVSITVRGTNFDRMGDMHDVAIPPFFGSYINTWTINTAAGTATKVFPGTAFESCSNSQLTYCNGSDRNETPLYLTYENVTPAEITGVSIAVDKDVVRYGAMTIAPTSNVFVTVWGTNFENLGDRNLIRLAPGKEVCVADWTVDTSMATATIDLTENIDWFASCDSFVIQYSNDGGTTWISTELYLTYDESAAAARISGVSVTVDGTTYTGGNVTIKPDSKISFTVSGSDFQNLSQDNRLNYSMGCVDKVSADYGWEIDTSENTASWVADSQIDYFAVCSNFEVRYSNDGGTNWISTGIYLTYDDGIAEEDRAKIESVSVTVAGVTHTAGSVIIAPETESVTFTVAGTNFVNLNADHALAYCEGYAERLNSGVWAIDTENNTAAWTLNDTDNFFAQWNAYPVSYSNNYHSADLTWETSSISLTYTDCDHSSGSVSYQNGRTESGKHEKIYSCCGYAVAEGHTFADGTCSACGYSGGYCGGEGDGTNLTWTLVNNVLTISGTGAMADYVTEDFVGSPAPWSGSAAAITGVSIAKGVTDIGTFAFCDLTGLESIAIPASVTALDHAAFHGCTELQTVTFAQESGLTFIGEIVFENCTSLTQITIPAGVKHIGTDAFANCTGLNTVNAPCDWDGSLYTFAESVTVNIAEHIGGTATCTTQAICDTCGASYGELGAHTPGATGKCTVEGCGYQYPAKVGDTFYETIHKALRAAEGNSGCTLTLLDDITLTSMSSTASYVNMGTFTLDLNGKTLSSNKGTLSVLGSANLTIKDSVGGGKIVSTGSNAINQSGGKVTIESGTFEGTLDGVFLSYSSTLIVKGGSFIGSRAMITGFGSDVEIDLTAVDPAGFTLKNNGSGTFAPNLPSGYAMVNGSGEVVTNLSANESATVKASLENATVTLDKTTFTYDGQPHKPGVTVTLSGRKLTEGTDYRVFYSGVRKMQDGKPSQWFEDYATSADCINAGEDYYAVVIGLGNYYTKDAFTLYENFVIKPKEVTELTFVGLNEVYAHTGEAIEPTFSVKDGETEISTSEYTVAYSNNTEMGTATITITDNEGGNYTVSGSKTFQIVVHTHVWNYSASGNTITAICSGDIGTCPDPEQSITLTVPEDYTYTGDATYSASVEGSIDGVTCSVLYTGANTGYSSSEAPVNADTYTVTLTAGGESVSDSFAISPKNIANCTASLSEDQFAYSGKAPELGVTVVDGSVGNSTLTKDTDYTVGDVQSNAGIYKLTVTGIGNYTGTLELDYTITAKEVSIIGAEIKAVTYDPAGYTLNVTGVTFGGVVEGENLAYTATAELTGTNAVGERDATVTLTLNNSNYTLKTATYKATVTINKAVATVTAAPTAKALTYTGEAKDLINGGSANGGEMQYSTDNETWSTTIPQGTDAGEYTVYYKVVADANHSDTEPGNIKVKIDKALLTVTAKDNTIAYGEVPAGNGVEYSGFANGETEAVLGGTVAYTYNYQRYGNVGSYKITPAGLTSGNYDITFADGILTVVAKTITVTAEGKSKTYGDADPELTYKVEGLVNGDELTGALSREAGAGVGTYAIIQGNLTVGGNYAITFTGADFTISKRSVTITAKDQTIFYGMEISNTEIAANGLVDGHSVTATLTPSTTMLTENGTITASNAVIKANGADVTANYEISYEDGKLVIAFDTSVIDALEPETVTSDDQSDLEEILDTIDELLEEEGMTEEQKKTLEDSKAKAEKLLDVIKSAQDDLNTENTEKVEDVTADNVKPEDKEALEAAKADLEKALKDNAGNYTEEEKQDIRDEIQRIEDAMTTLENVEDVTEAIEALPETVKPDDEETAEKILGAKKAYDALTEHEKSLVDETAKKKLDNLVAALTDYDIIKGDGGKWNKGSSSGLSFTANGPFSKFVGIEVDDKEVDEKYYDAKSGSTIITLKKSFLKKLSTGKHTITVLYTDGETSGTFKILAASSNPATGDDSNIMLSSSVCAVSFMALAALFLKSRKHKQRK